MTSPETPMPGTAELLPCPFCGDRPKIYEAVYEGEARSVGCDGCSFYLDEFDHTDCIAAWNTRAPS